MPRLRKELKFMGGVNRFDHVRSIRDDQAYKLQNLIPVGPEVLGTRGAMVSQEEVLAGAGFGMTSTVVPLAGLFPPRAVGSINLVLAYLTGTGGDLKFYGTAYGGGGAPVSKTLAAPTLERRPSLVYFNKKVYCFVGTPLTGRSGYVLAEDLSPLGYSLSDFNFAGTQTTRPIPAGMCAYRRRAVFWNLGPNYEDYLAFSDNDDPSIVGDEILASNGRAFRIGSRDAGKIIHCREVMLNAVGSPAQSALLVLRERAAYLLTGEPNQSTDVTEFIPPDMVASKFNVDCGCISGATVVETPYGVLWASEDDIWCFQVGQVPFRIGTNIRPILTSQSASKRWMLHAEYFAGFYRLACFDSSQSSPAVTDPLKEQWWLDLRSSMPSDHTKAAWFGPQIFTDYWRPDAPAVVGTYCMFRDQRSGQTDTLYGLQRAANATAYGINTVKFDQADNEDYSVLDTHASSYRRNGNKFVLHAIAKDMDFEQKNVYKIYERSEVEINTDIQAKFVVTDLLDAGAETTAVVLTTGNDTDYDTDSSTDEFESIASFPTSDTRPKGKRHQPRLLGYSGYVIDSTNNKVGLGFDAPGLTFTAEEYELTEGYYGDLKSLLDHVVSVLNETYAPNFTFSHNVSSDPDTRNEFVELTVTNSLQFYPRINALFSDEAKALCDLLGFTSSWSGTAADTQTADAAVPWELAPKVRLGGIIVQIRTIPRLPDGA